MKNIGEHLETNLAELKNELDQLRKAKLDKIEPDIKKSENFIAKINHLHTQISGIKQELYEQVRGANHMTSLNTDSIF